MKASEYSQMTDRFAEYQEIIDTTSWPRASWQSSTLTL